MAGVQNRKRGHAMVAFAALILNIDPKSNAALASIQLFTNQILDRARS
jgi:hypothetical protein